MRRGRPLTITGFIKRLREANRVGVRRFELSKHNEVRMATPACGDVYTTCPITGLCYRQTGLFYDLGHTVEAGAAIGLPKPLVDVIVAAADEKYARTSRARAAKVRREMLAALDLTEAGR